jgi:phage terminase small subunit
MNDKKRKLTAKQQRFVQEYLIDLNATQAAIRAGYSPVTANQTGPENLVKPGIIEEINRLQKVISDKFDLTMEWVVEQLRIEATNRSDNASHSARVRAIELLGKHIGMFSEKIRIEDTIKLQIVEEIIEPTCNTEDNSTAPNSA